jgi:hypothetical protein
MKYDAFISYSHRRDRTLARHLQGSLESIGRPRFKLRSMRVYRDETNLAATPDLLKEILSAVADSRFFLLLASPEAARSDWINKEVAQHLQGRSPRRMAIVQTAGALPWTHGSGGQVLDMEDCAITPELSGQFAAHQQEPLIVDLRPFRDSSRWSRVWSSEYLRCVATLAAAILERDKDELYGMHLTRQRQSLFILVLTLIVVLGLLGATWIQRNRSLTLLAESAFRTGQSRAEAHDLSALVWLNKAQKLSPDESRRAAYAIRTAYLVQHAPVFAYNLPGMWRWLAFSNDLSTVAAIPSVGALTVHDLSIGRQLSTQLSSSTMISSIAVSPDGSTIAAAVRPSADAPMAVTLCQAETGKILAEYRVGFVADLTFAHDTRTLLAVAKDPSLGTVTLFGFRNLAKGKWVVGKPSWTVPITSGDWQSQLADFLPTHLVASRLQMSGERILIPQRDGEVESFDVLDATTGQRAEGTVRVHASGPVVHAALNLTGDSVVVRLGTPNLWQGLEVIDV